MKHTVPESASRRLKFLFIGRARDLKDKGIFSRMTLVAFFAWVGLGSDGLSSSCYGPDEAYRFLGDYHRLAIFVAIAIVITIFIISTSYSQIIKLFPSGGGGYKVATKLLNPTFGMISGCALVIDYILTISVSIASGADAIFSFLPPVFHDYKLILAIAGVIALIVLNLRGVKESVFSLMPIFIIFVVLHAFLILFSILHHATEFPKLYSDSMTDLRHAGNTLGTAGLLMLMLRSFTMGAGTFTGIEAVSNSIPILKEPRVRTGIVTMRYMAISLAVVVFGLMLSYTFLNITPSPYKTVNASLLQSLTSNWSPGVGLSFMLVTLIAEAALLFIAAQTGFLDGPRVMSNMAGDSWFPRRFAVLSDRLVIQNGILFMGITALVILLLTRGSVKVLVILYSINVFITFGLSQTGMVRHWWIERVSDKHWVRHLMINGIGLVLTLVILASILIIKFREGGWITLLITSALIFGVTRIKRHYKYAEKQLSRFNTKMFHYVETCFETNEKLKHPRIQFDKKGKTAVICVNGYNGLGIYSFLEIKKDFTEYKNIVFLEIGLVDSGNFKGASELKNLEKHVTDDLAEYRKLSESFGFYTETLYSIGTDVADEIKEMSKKIKLKHPDAIFFVGQFILPKTTAFQRMLHNQSQFAIQNRLAHKGFILVMIPVRAYLHI